MHGGRAGLPRRVQQRLDIEIAFIRRRRADADAFVGVANVQRFPVSFGVNGDAGHTQVPARAQNADGDFASICN
jgi:hypothetical protein